MLRSTATVILIASTGLIASSALAAWPQFSGSPLSTAPLAGAAYEPGGAPRTVWIGVRMEAVPEALAAHLGKRGLMVSNVAVGGPADRAGLQRYDILLEFNGQTIESYETLVNAVRSSGAGSAVSCRFLRGGKEQTLTITPEVRSDEPVEMRHPEAAAEDEDLRYFGHRLKRDELGNWIFEPLGRLRDLPDGLPDVNDPGFPAWHGWIDAMRGNLRDPLRMPTWNSNTGNPFFEPDDAGADNVEISIRVARGGTELQIRRNDDGSIRVERTDAHGQTQVTDHADMETFRTADPDAYRTYRQYSGYRLRPMITVPPGLDQLREQQDLWKQELERALDGARSGSVPDRIREQSARLRSRLEATGGAPFSRTARMSTSPSGEIEVFVNENGVERRYRFPSAEQFRLQEPALYEELSAGLPLPMDDAPDRR